MTKRAVVVGIDDYSVQGIRSLRVCTRDAKAFYHLLVDAFDFEPANILTYLDQAASSAAILQALRYCVTQSQPGRCDLFLLLRAWQSSATSPAGGPGL